MSAIGNAYPYWLGQAPVPATQTVNGLTVNTVPQLVVTQTGLTNITASGTLTTITAYTTTTILQAGTYLITASVYTTAPGTGGWTTADLIGWAVTGTTTANVTTNPAFSVLPYYQAGSTNPSWSPVVGLLILTGPSTLAVTLQYKIINSTAKYTINGVTYQQIA